MYQETVLFPLLFSPPLSEAQGSHAAVTKDKCWIETWQSNDDRSYEGSALVALVDKKSTSYPW